MREDGKAVRDWWLEHLRPEHHPAIGEDTSAARALRARLRRPASPVEVLAERAVHELAARLPFVRKRADDLIQFVQLVRVLAAVERERSEPTARRERLAVLLGRPQESNDRPRMSDTRFQRLIRSSGTELGTALRRALPLVGETCDVAQLASDMLDWPDSIRGERVRTDWCFDYFGASRPAPAARDSQEDMTE